MEKWLSDFRYGFRTLRKSPGFTAVVLCTLGLGIGANTAIFSVVHSVLLRPLSYRQPDRLVAIWESLVEPGFEKFRVAPGNYLDWRQNRVFEEMAMFGASRYSLTGEGEPEQLLGGKITEGYFRTLGVEPLLGRVFSQEEETPGRDNVVLLSYGLWQRRFGGNSEILGQPVTFDGNLFTIIGVMPQGIYPTWLNSVGQIQFRPDHHQFWVPMALPEGFRTTRRSHVFGVLARLRSGVSFQEAQLEMETIGRRLEQAFPENAKERIVVTRLVDEVVGAFRSGLLVLLGAVGLVLAIVCANIAGLMLARSASRQREVAVRAALGASRGDVVRQFFAESLLLGLGGGALGLGAAYFGHAVLTRITPHGIPRFGDDRIDFTVLCFAAVVSILASVMFGLVPAFQFLRPNLHELLKEGGRGTAGDSDRRHGFRRALVVAEVSLAVMLVIGAGLLIRSFSQLVQVDPGFRADRILTFELDLSQTRYPHWSRVMNGYSTILERVRELPGVRSAAIAYDLPLEANWETVFRIAGRPEPRPGDSPGATLRLVSPDYLRTTGIELVRGRAFVERDDAEHPGVAIINSSLARRYFLDEDPMGQILQHHNTAEDLPSSFEIVGIVKDVKFRGLDASVEPALYLPARQFIVGDMGVLVRTAADPLALLPSVRAEVAAVDPNLPIFRVGTLEAFFDNSVAQPRFNMLLLSLFGLAALVLAAIGIYGLLSHTVAERTHEIGVRMALGARAKDVLRLFVGQGLRLTAIGLVLGMVGAVALARVMESLLFGVSSTDPATFVGVVATLAAVAGLASYLPARRATQVDPMVALRHD